MNSLIYAGVVLAGAITLLIEAYRNYNSSLTSIPFREHPILQNVEVAKLCTPREKNIGFLFYSLLYLVTYVIVLSSTEIYELVTQAAASNAQIGPTDDFASTINDPVGLLNTQYGKPIFISAAIISVFSIGALRPVESTMRSLAHRLAGVPRGVYAVIEDLHAIPFEEFDVECQQPLTDMFTENAEKVFEGSYDKSQIPSIRTALRAIDYLAPAVTGKQRSQHFPFTQLEKMAELSESLETSVEKLKGHLKERLKDEDSARKKVFVDANAVANDTIALFAVHFLRNNRAIKNYSDKSAIALINERIKRGYQVELNSFAMGLLFSMLAIPVAFAAYYFWIAAAAPVTAQNLQGKVGDALLARQFEDPEVAICKETPPEDLRFDKPAPATAQPDAPLEGAKRQSCASTWKKVAKTAFAERRQLILSGAFWAVFGVFFSSTLAAITAIFGREVRKEDNSWPQWKIRRIPFLRLFSLAVVPAIMAVFGVVIGSFLEFWINADFSVTENQVAFFFQSKLEFFAMHAGLGFIVAIGVLMLMDQHDHLSAAYTIPLGVLFAIIALCWYYLTIVAGYAPGFIRETPDGFPLSFEQREAIIYGAHPFFFLIFFAIFLEITEDTPAERQRRRKFFGRFRKARS